MGFLDKLKDTFNQLTGAGNMQVQLDSMQVARGGSISFTATLTATGNLKGKSVTAEILAVEHVEYEVEVKDISTTPTTPQGGAAAAAGSATTTTTPTITTRTEQRSKDNQTYQNKQVLAQGEFQLPEGQTRQFTGSLQIPATAQPTYTGVSAKHTWKVRVSVDVPMGADITGEAEFTVN